MTEFISDEIVKEDLSNIAQSIIKQARVLEGKTILITGGSGFLGSYLVGTLIYLNNYLFKNPCKIISVDNYITSSKKRKKEYPFLTYLEHDVSKKMVVRGDVDYIIHAAGIASPFYYMKYPLETIDVSVNGTKNILELARQKNARGVLYFSSSEIYGDPAPEALPTKETYRGNVSSTGPRACYDESKRLGETLCMAYFNIYKTPIKIVRPFNIYGPGMKKNDFRVIPTFIARYLQNKKTLPIYLGGKQTRTFCYISDAIEAFFLVLFSEKNGEVYNVGNDKKEISIYNLAGTMKKILDNNLEISKIDYPQTYPQDEPKRRYPDIMKIKNELGFYPKINLEDGLQRIITWCRVNWEVGPN